MEKNQLPLEVSLTEKALNLITSLEMCNPQLMITLGYVRQFSGGYCGRGISKPTPHLKVKLSNRNVDGGFVKLESKAGISVYISEPIYGSITKIGVPLKMEIGFFKKAFVVSGLHVNNLVEADTPSKMRMDYH